MLGDNAKILYALQVGAKCFVSAFEADAPLTNSFHERFDRRVANSDICKE